VRYYQNRKEVIFHLIHYVQPVENTHVPQIEITQKPPSSFVGDDGAVLVRHKQAFKSTRNTFKKLPLNSKKIYLTELSFD